MQSVAYTGCSIIIENAPESEVETEQPQAGTETMLLEEWDEWMSNISDED